MMREGIKRLLVKLGFGWVFGSGEEIEALSLSEIEPIFLTGNFDTGVALGEYSISGGVTRKRTQLGYLLHKFKYEQDRQAGKILAVLASDFIKAHPLLRSSELILTVPPSFKSRAFDPTSFMAERIEQMTKIRWEKDSLRRIRITKPQKEIRRIELKRLNVLDTFKVVKPSGLKGRRLLLIDDLSASGATLNQIASLLREAKPEKIFALVLAKTAFSTENLLSTRSKQLGLDW